jgi:hypothetical protein
MPDKHSTTFINNKKSELIRDITGQMMEIEYKVQAITGKWPPNPSSVELKELQEMKKRLSIILNSFDK